MCDIVRKRRAFKIKKASMAVQKDSKPRIVYQEGDQVEITIGDSFLDAGLDGRSVIPVCMIRRVEKFSQKNPLNP